MEKIWLLFIFIVVVLVGYMMYSGDEVKDAPPAPAPIVYMPPQPEQKQYHEVGDMSEDTDVALLPEQPAQAN